MPALPWIQVSEPDADATCIVMASRLPLTSYAHLPSFIRATTRIRRQLANAEGLLGYSLDAHVLSKTFWTLSAWRDQEALDRFARGEPHRSVMAATRPHMNSTTFVTWTTTGSELPAKWETAREEVKREAGDR